MSAEAKAPEAVEESAEPQMDAVPAEQETLEDIARDIEQQQAADGEGAEPEPDAEAKPAEPDADEAKEAKDAEAQEEAPKGPPARGWAKVKQKEKRLIQREKELKRRASEFEGSAKSLAERTEAVAAAEKALEEDVVGFLAKKGITFDDIAKRFLADGKASPEETQRRGAEKGASEIAELKEMVSKLTKSLSDDKAKAAEARDVGNYKSALSEVVDSEEFELLRAFPDIVDTIYEEADRLYKETGEALQPKEAASRMLKSRRRELESLSTHQAVRSLFEKDPGRSQAPQAVKGTSPRTLTNNLAAVPTPESKDIDDLSPDEDFQGALRLAMGD